MTVLDGWLTSLALMADVLGRRYSFRVGRWVWIGAAGAHEALLTIAGRLGWIAVPPALVLAAQTLSVNAVPRYPAGVRSTGNPSERADELLRGVYVSRDGTNLRLDTFPWDRDPFEDTSGGLWFVLHTFDWLRELEEAYGLTGNQAYLDQAKELTARWISHCLYKERLEGIWDDHATAIRAIALCRLWDACRSSEPSGSCFMGDLAAAVIRHGEKLAHNSFYRPEHNHGITQAYALLAIGFLFPMYASAQSWIALARSRLEAQMVGNVSTEGIHREHSPYYQFYLFRQFFYAHQLAHAHGVSFSKDYRARLESMLASGAYLLKPDGTLPALGDTSRTSHVLVERHEHDEWPVRSADAFLYSITRGESGAPPPLASIFFPGGGYAVLRSGWGTTEPFADERFFALRVSNFDSSHIHQDLFSFELYAYGDDLIVDSGGPFAYGNPIREYFLSTAAHNTVVVDGLNQRVGEGRVLHWHASPEFDVLDVEHVNYPGVLHRRVVVFVRPRYFLILDHLTSDKIHLYSQTFHLNPALEVALRDLTVRTKHTSGGPTVQIIPLIETGLGFRLHRGTVSPRQGWVCTADHQMTPNSVVGYEKRATTATFAVLIVPEPPRVSSPILAYIDGAAFREETRIRIVAGEAQDEIVFTPSGHVSIRKTPRNTRPELHTQVTSGDWIKGSHPC